MADTRFFPSPVPIRLGDAAALTGAALTSSASQAPDAELFMQGVAPLETAGKNDISFLDNIKYLPAFAASNAGACFVKPQYIPRAPAGMALLVTEEPYFAYAQLAGKLYPEPKITPGISPAAHIAPDAVIGQGCRIDAGAVIESRASIGAGCWIGAGSVIGSGVEIGDKCRIGANCTISHAIIGSYTVLHRGVHIGTDGFGFAGGKAGLVKVPQLGRVIIGKHVEIGSGTCIDRGAGPDTTIGDYSKIDNLVQIGHNVQIGRFVLLAAQVGIAGSTIVEDGVMMGGQVGIGGHVTIGARAKLAAQAGVMADIPPGSTYGGSPAVPIKDWHRQTVALHQMIKRKETHHD